MTNIPTRHTYHSPVLSWVSNALWAVLAFFLAHWLYVGSGGGLSAHSSILNLLGSIALAAAGAYCLYAAIPYSMRFDPVAKTYEYRWGVGPISRRRSGVYADLDSIVVNESTSSFRLNYRAGGPDRWRTSDTVDVIWLTEHRRVPLASLGDVEQAKLAAEEIAKATGLPYGGTYDFWNKMWIEGPFHKQITHTGDEGEPHAVESIDDDEQVVQHTASQLPHPPLPPNALPAQHAIEPHPPAGLADAPPALGDDAGLNESDMWK